MINPTHLTREQAIDRLVNDLENWSREELVKIARRCFGDLYPCLSNDELEELLDTFPDTPKIRDED